jgi:predicted Zn finger-like uncharacterized protein
MSLATRCISCGTVFRVVQDQLKVSEGWVRCGRCNEVFNAIEGLFDLERDAPPNWKPPPAPPAPPAASVAAAYDPQAEPPDDDEVFQLSDNDRIHSRFFQPEQADVDQTPAQSVKHRDRRDFAEARFNEALLSEQPLESETRRSGGTTGIPRSSVKAARAQLEAARRGPGFVQEAKQRERWRSPGMRVLLGFLVLLLGASLAGQAGYHFRDLWSARWPAARPAFAMGCEWLRCELQPPRRIDDVVVESSTLSPAPGGSGYRLSLVLRNRGPMALAMPWIDLKVTDSTEQVLARKALAPADFRVTPPVLAPGSESTLQLIFSSSDPRRVNGYTVEAFYP